jgi:hypothetical protein
MSAALRPGAEQAVASVFALYAEFVVPNHYFRGASNLTTLNCLIMPVPADLVDGTTILPNDERVLVAASELVAVDQPRPGDHLIQSSNSLRRDVITAHPDVTCTLWALVTRRQL